MVQVNGVGGDDKSGENKTGGETDLTMHSCLNESISPSKADGHNTIEQHEAEYTPPPVQWLFVHPRLTRHMDVHSTGTRMA